MTDKNGYHDGIKNFYSIEEISGLVMAALKKSMSKDDPLENRVYLVLKELPDAKIGTVLRPAINDQGRPSTRPEYKDHYNYASKYVGRNSFLHREIVENEKDWFARIN